MSAMKNSWGVYGLVLRGTLLILSAWVLPLGLAIESPTKTVSTAIVDSFSTPTSPSSNSITRSFSLETSRVSFSESASISSDNSAYSSSITFVETSTNTASLSTPLVNKEATPAYNSSNGEPPPPLRTSLDWSNVIYGILFVCLGLVEVFHGYKYIRITLFVMGYLFFASTAVVILLITDSADGNIDSVAFYFLIWLLVGLTGAILSFFCWHIGLMLTAAYGGFTISVSLLALAHLENYAIRWTIAGIVMIILSVIVHFYERHVIIFATSIGGAYTFIFGIDYFVCQGFRDMIELADPDGFLLFRPTPPIYAMVGSVFVLAALGIAYEYKAHEEPIGHFWVGNGHRRAGSISAFEILSPNANRTNSRTTPLTTEKTTNDGPNTESSSSHSRTFRTFGSSLFGRKPKARPSLNHVTDATEDSYVIQMEEI